MARQLNGSSEVLTFSAGAIAGQPQYGTVAVLVNRNLVGGADWQCPIYSGNGGSATWGAAIDIANTSTIWTGWGSSKQRQGSTAFNQTGRWYTIVCVWPTTGGGNPRISVRDHTAGTWNHQDIAPSNTSESTPTVSLVQLGAFGGPADWFNGAIAAAGIWRQLVPANNAAVEALGLHLLASNWTALAAPNGRAIWVPGMAATSTPIADRTGGGATETSLNVGTVVADPVGWNDIDGGGGTNWQRTITDPLGATDTLTRVAAARRTITDPVGLVDSRAGRLRKVLVDPLGLTDTRTSRLRKTLTDPLGLSDTLARAAATRRAFDDDLGLTDSLARVGAASRTLVDPLGLTDMLDVEKVVRLVLVDSLGLSDELNRTAGYGRAIVDGLTGSDSLGDVEQAARTIDDDLALVDVLDRLAEHGRTITDALGATDSTTWVHHQRRTIVDLLSILDVVSVQTAGAGQVSLSDPLGLTDALLRVVAARRALVDSLTLSDVLNAAVRRARELTDALALTDTVERTSTAARTIADPVTITDTLVAQITSTVIQVVIRDDLQLTDTLEVASTVRRVLVDELALTDTIEVADAVRLYAAAAGLVLRAWRAGTPLRRFTAYPWRG